MLYEKVTINNLSKQHIGINVTHANYSKKKKGNKYKYENLLNQ